MIGKSYRIIVKDLSKLENYGFEKIEQKESLKSRTYEYSYRWYSGITNKYGEKTWCISVNSTNKKINMMTCGGAALKVLCEMFRDGVIKFIPRSPSIESRIAIKKRQIEKLEKELETLCQNQ